MRVLMLGWELPPHVTGGLGAACAGLAAGLAELGVEVAFVAPRLQGDERVAGVRLVDASAHVPPGENTVPFAPRSAYSAAGPPARGGGPAAAGRYGSDLRRQVEWFAAAARDVARGERFDVVHAHDWTAYPAGEAAAATCGAPLVVHVHSTEHDRCPLGADPAVVAVEQRAFDVARAIVCVSRYEAAVVASRYAVDERRMAVVHNAVDAPVVEGRRATRRIAEPLVLFCGRITAQKGPIAFLDAARRVLQVEPRARFVVAGTGDLWAASIEHAAAIGIARQVHFTGFLAATEVERAYGEADVYVMPSTSEPFGLGAVEAAARGVPVVLSRNSGALEAIPSAIAADFADPEDLADKVLACLRRPGLREEASSRAREEALRHGWRRQAARVAAVYERVAA